MILADTSVWVQHLREESNRLNELLDEGEVCCHPFVIGELACGTMRNRREILLLLERLPTVKVAEHAEVLSLIESRRLMGRGLGWVDVHLLAATLLSTARLWTLDDALTEGARLLGISANQG